MVFKKLSEDNYYSNVDHEKFGLLEWTEKFSAEGIQVVSNLSAAFILKFKNYLMYKLIIDWIYVQLVGTIGLQL